MAIEKYVDAVYDEKLKGISTPYPRMLKFNWSTDPGNVNILIH